MKLKTIFKFLDLGVGILGLSSSTFLFLNNKASVQTHKNKQTSNECTFTYDWENDYYQISGVTGTPTDITFPANYDDIDKSSFSESTAEIKTTRFSYNDFSFIHNNQIVPVNSEIQFLIV